MQFITTDQRIAVENFEVGLIYTVTFSNGDSFTGACIGIGHDFVAFQRTAPKLLFCLTMTTAADVASIEPLSVDIGKILAYTGSVPVSIKTDGTPLLDYLITGSTVQDGTPTPENPIMPQGTGERTGNLYNTTATVWALGILDDNGQPTGSTSSHYTTNYTEVLPQTAYLLSGTISTTGSLRVYFYDSDKSWISRTTQKTTGDFTTPQNCSYIRIQVTVTIADTSDWMLNTGSTALPYEPYGYKIPISSANTTTPVYLGEVETTRRIAKIDLGTLNWRKMASGNFWAATAIQNIRLIGNASTGNAICDMFKEASPNAVANEPYSFSSCLNSVGRPFINKAGFEDLTAEEFKQAMSGVYMYYVLATEETAVVNEPLMHIGGYADTLSFIQSGIKIPTTDGLDIFDIDTTVKPSEVYLKYFSPLF